MRVVGEGKEKEKRKKKVLQHHQFGSSQERRGAAAEGGVSQERLKQQAMWLLTVASKQMPWGLPACLSMYHT